MIEIISYRSEWPSEFAKLANALRDALGDRIKAIHHIGSTSVPGLAAKDVIDLQITVGSLKEDFDDEFSTSVESAGFVLGKPTTDHAPPGVTLPDSELAKRFYKSTGRPANLHIREAERFNQRYAILCRDYLRAHKRSADAYGEIKKQLAKRFSDDIDAYYDIKDPTTDLIMVGAEEWAAITGWTVPPSD